MRYSIEGQELTDIADALRRKHGEMKMIACNEQVGDIVVSKTENATGFDSWDGYYSSANQWDVVTIAGAHKIKIKVSYSWQGTMAYLRVQPGNYNNSYSEGPSAVLLQGEGYRELEFDGDTVTFLKSATTANTLGYYAECTGYAIEKGVPRTYKSSEMASAIDELEKMPEEALTISGNCKYRFFGGGWNWFLDNYKESLSTKDIIDAEYMFAETGIENIPFEINLKDGANTKCTNIFSYTDITKAPYINGVIGGIGSCFNYCTQLKEIPDDWASRIDWSYMHSYAYCSINSMFQNCYSIKNIPESLLAELWGTGTSGTYVSYGGMFNGCYALGAANEIGVHQGIITSNRCSSMLNGCTRLGSLTFKMQLDGTPYTTKWKSQTIDTLSCGWGNTNSMLNHNAGITADKEVKDDATYQALKNDPDWFTGDVAYSRYNHDSAVETINSLPDTSAYGTNTIKFNGSAGSKTDGGAINTLTEEEIAVAAAKGWTVTLS